MSKMGKWVIYIILIIIVCTMLEITNQQNLWAYFGGMFIGTVFGLFVEGSDK